MFPSFIIVFREGFEMMLVITLLLAAVSKFNHAKKWILGGACIGGLISLILGIGAFNNSYINTIIKSPITGFAILVCAATLIAWTVIWMQKQGKELTSKIKETLNMEAPLKSLAIVACLTILREGSEIILFLLGLMANGNTNPQNIILGSLGGGISAIIIGVLMYFGLLKINIRKAFLFFSFLMSFMAAGMYGNAVSKLVKHNIISPIIPQLWDTSAIFDHHTNTFALIAHVVFGYSEHPSLMQFTVYIFSLVCIFMLKSKINREHVKHIELDNI